MPSIRDLQRSHYEPRFIKKVDQRKLIRELSDFVSMPEENIAALHKTYRKFHRMKGYRKTLSEKKTLCFEEAFAAFTLLSVHRPKRIVEIGTQYGNSTRRLVDMAKFLKLGATITCFDVEDQLKWCTKDEVRLVVKDLTGKCREDLFEAYRPDFIYLDAHPYALLKDVIEQFLDYHERCVMAVHDCAVGICNPNMTVPKEDPHVDSANGVWERHVLAEAFGVEDVLSEDLDNLKTETHRLRILDTPHGLALLSRRRA